MRSVRFSETEDRPRHRRLTRTNSGSADSDPDLVGDELTRRQDALLRERSRERRRISYLEDDDIGYYHSRYEDDKAEEMVRRLLRSTDRGAQTARYLDIDPMVRPLHPLSDATSSVIDPRRGTRSSTSSQLDDLDRRVFLESLQRKVRALHDSLEQDPLLWDQHLIIRSTDSSRLSERLSAILPALRRPVPRPRSARPANPSGEPATPSTEMPPIIPNQESSPEAEIQNKLLDLLWSQPVGLIHDHLSKSRVSGSGEWIFALPAFESWQKTTTGSLNSVERGENCLWLQGSLGAGKTMLMNAVINRLKSEIAKEPEQESIVAYYYFDRSGGCKPYHAVSSLLRQLCDQKGIPLPRFLAEMQTSGSDVANSTGNRQLSGGIWIANLVSDFLSVQSRFKRVYICLDGLEECDDLLDLMVILHRVSAVREIRLVATARSRIVKQCITLGVGRKEMVVQLEDHNSSDIRRYLEAFVQCQQHTCLFDMIGKDAHSGLCDKLVEKSGGNCLSAVAQAAQLNRFASLAEVTSQLEKPPARLSEVVDLVLSRFNDQSPQRSRLAQRVLYWLSVARRPLTVQELQQAVAAEPGAKIDDPNRLPPPSLITTVCMGLVQIDVEKNRVFTTPSALPFYLYQFATEFARQAREYAAITCLALLQSDTLSRGPFTSQSQYDEMEQRLPFANYVSQNWGVHLNDAGDEESMNGILENDSLLETLSQVLHVSLQSTSVPPRSFDNYPGGFGSRHFGAYFGLTLAFDKWSTEDDWAVARDSWNRSPFHVCFRTPGLYQRHVLFDVLEGENFSNLIMESVPSKSQSEPGDEDPENGDQAKPFRHEPVGELPWKWGLDYYHNNKAFRDSVLGKNLKKLFTFSKNEINVADKDGKTPLHHFLVDWSEDALIGLVQMSFDLEDAPDHEAENASESDNASESENAIESDNDSDAASDSKTSLGEWKFLPLGADNSGRTTLDYACKRNVVFGTLAFAIAKWSPEQLSNGIAIAASCGYSGLVTSLCEMIDEKHNFKGKKDFELGQAVIEASKRGFTDIVRLLRQRGTTLNTQDDDGMSPLHHAAYGCHTDTARFLLLEGADPNQLDKAGRSPLFCGCESGSDTIVTLLREKGASATRTNGDGQTLLHLAAGRGNVGVARRLLRLDGGAGQLRTPDPEAAGHTLRSPLHIAAREGYHAVVQLLVEEGFQIDACDGDGRTPLSYACEGGHLESVQVLLTKKRFAGVNSTDKNRRTPLSYAAAEGHVDVVAALVGQGGVDPNIKDAEGKTALIHAAQRGHNDTVVVLTVLASNSYTARAAVTRSFKELYSRFLNRPTGNIAVDVNMKDDQGRSAVSYLRENGAQGASDVARYIVEIGEKPKPKAPMDGVEGRVGGGDGYGNKPAEYLDHPMADYDRKAGQQLGAIDRPVKDQIAANVDKKTGDDDTQIGAVDAA